MTTKRADTPLGRQEKHLREKYGKMRELRKKYAIAGKSKTRTIEITDEERKVLLSLVSKIEGGE